MKNRLSDMDLTFIQKQQSLSLPLTLPEIDSHQGWDVHPLNGQKGAQCECREVPLLFRSRLRQITSVSVWNQPFSLRGIKHDNPKGRQVCVGCGGSKMDCVCVCVCCLYTADKLTRLCENGCMPFVGNDICSVREYTVHRQNATTRCYLCYVLLHTGGVGKREQKTHVGLIHQHFPPNFSRNNI